MFVLINLALLAVIVSIYFGVDGLQGQNPAARIWTNVELISLTLEIPFTVIQNYYAAKKMEIIKTGLMNKSELEMADRDSFGSDHDH